MAWAGVVVILLIGVYAFTMPKTITLEDAGLFQMICHKGGIGHPPGYPLFILGCQAFVGLPFFDDSVLAANLLSAVFAAVTGGCLVFLGFELFQDRLTAVLIGLGYGLSATFWSQAIIVEVYSLAALLFVLCFWLCLKYQQSARTHYLYLLAFVYGLGLSNHWPLLGLATPALICMLLPRFSELLDVLTSVKALAITGICLLLGLIPYLTLFQASPPFAPYGAVESLEDFIKYVSRAAYNDQFEAATWLDKGQYQLWLLEQSFLELGIAAIPMTIAGLVLSFTVLRPAISISLVLVYLGSTSLLVLLLGFEFNEFRQAIFRPYPIIAYLSLAIWMAIGTAALIRWLERRQLDSGLAVPITVAVVLSVFLSNFAPNYRRENTFALQYADKVFELTPQDAVLFAEGDTGVGLLGYLHHVRGVRQDLELRSWNNLVFQNRLTSPFASDELQKKARDDYISQSARPVMMTGFHGWPVVSYGIVFGASMQRRFECAPNVHPYVEYLVELDQRNLLKDGHERRLLFGLLLDFTRHHVGLVLQNGASQSEEVRVLNQLQTTFAGKIATLETMIGFSQHESAKMMLKQLGDEAANSLPPGSSRQVRSVLHEYRGRIERLPPQNLELARQFFERSLEIYPLNENTSICPLRAVYRDLGQAEEIASLDTRFGAKQCLKDSH